MYALIIRNNISNSPLKEFGKNNSLFQIVLQDKAQYQKIRNLIEARIDIIDETVGKISFSFSDTAQITKAMAVLLANGYVDRQTMDHVLNFIVPGHNVALPSNLTPSLAEDSDEKIVNFFNEYLEKKISTISLEPYPGDRDGGLNPALKIFGTKYRKNKMDNGRWEIFVLLKNEAGEIGLRSGVKSETWDYNDLRVTQQFDFSLFPNPLTREIKLRLLAYRNGHPSLALNFSELDRGNFRALPVFAGGWVLRNDLQSILRLQVYWSSGRYNRNLSGRQLHLLQLCVAFNLMTEYGKDFKVEFYNYRSITMTDFITKRANGGMQYDWNSIVKDVQQLIAEETRYQPSSLSLK